MRAIILSYIEERTAASTKMQKGCDKQTVMLQWSMPPNGVMKINVDGTVNRCGSIGAGEVFQRFSLNLYEHLPCLC